MDENDPIRNPQTWRAMESCRPGHNDQADPEMAPLARQLAESPELAKAFERLQRIDAALARAFRDVPVPEGLESRVLSRLAARAAQGQPLSPEAAVASPPQAEFGHEEPGPHRSPRRRWLLVAGSVAATAAAVFLVVYSLLGRRGEFSKWDVLSFAIECRGNDSADGGRLLGATEESPRYPLSDSLVSLASGQFSQVRWRSLVFLNRHAVAYDLIGPEGRIATVYVSSCSVEGLPSDVPPHPMHSTGEVAVSAWQEGGLLYVLAVDGGTPAYDRFFAVASGPLA